MKRRVFVLLGAATMTLVSVAGISGVTAPPAAAQTAPPTEGLGYVINLVGCVTSTNIGLCIRTNLRGLINSLFSFLPASPPTIPMSNATPSAAPSTPGTNAPTLNLPAQITGFLRQLPPALQTTPVAPAAAPVAPLNQLIPAPVVNRGLTTSAPRLPGASSIRSSLPKVPTAADIKLFSISDNAPVASSGSPVSGGDMMAMIGLGAVGAAAVTAATRRRAAARS